MMRHRRRVIFSVVVTAIVAGVSLQNFPVGTAAFIGTTKGFRVGLNLALAIALHYIPEVTESTVFVNGTGYWYINCHLTHFHAILQPFYCFWWVWQNFISPFQPLMTRKYCTFSI